MSELAARKHPYFLSVQPEETGGSLIFRLTPRGLQQVRGPDGTPKRVPQFVVAVRQEQNGLAFDWNGTLDDPGTARGEIEAEIAASLKDRINWTDRVTALVDQVEQWAREMNWSTRRVEKRLDDDWIGNHRLPALLMQEDTCKILLEPVGRSTPGAEGVVDLYLMPAYDDIASLYYYDNRWNVHYPFPATKAAATVREAEAVPLSKAALDRVLAELRQHAA